MNHASLQEKFAKIKPRMTDNEAAIESRRCLFCHDAPCTIACPSAIDIPMFIRQISSWNATGAAKTIFTQNILGKSCAYVCPTQMLCEGSCVYHGLNEKPIDIGRLQGYAADHAIDRNIRFFEKGKATNKKIAVVGAGPAGLSCAHELTRLGHDVTVFDANPKAGGLNEYGVAPYKVTNADTEAEVNYIRQIGFELKTGVRVVTGDAKKPNDMALSELEKNFDAVFLSLGLGRSQRPGIHGEDLDGVVGAAEFIHQLREKEQKIGVGHNVVVVGAGNTAMDAAIESALLGANVVVVYRRSEADQSAYAFEIEHARQVGVGFTYLTSPTKIMGKKRVEGLKCVRNELTAQQSKNEKGRTRTMVRAVPNSEFVIPCDMVILATGQEKFEEFYGAIDGVQLDKGKIIVNENFQTGNVKYFAGGDCINGGKEVVNAVADGRDAARGIDKFLQGNAQSIADITEAK